MLERWRSTLALLLLIVIDAHAAAQSMPGVRRAVIEQRTRCDGTRAVMSRLPKLRVRPFQCRKDVLRRRTCSVLTGRVLWDRHVRPLPMAPQAAARV